ncbi:MAG: cysteine synthase A [Bacilli bacterium]|nr:cysteine synthase A [Bacilli bacterium]MDD4077259.1 cysteine synthase A [Bacilli bacterium]MDD4388327.1 cysteine synthase A [Bacilli bacterium]
MIINSLLDLIGNTPVVAFESVYIKLEVFNLTGSVKDRPAKWMIEGMEQDGRLAPGDVIVEPTSGNTGISLAAIGAVKGYPVILVMPETMSRERRQIMAAYGAKIVLTPGEAGMTGAIKEATRLASKPGYVMPSQFTNQYNVLSHQHSTAQEIIDEFSCLDFLVAGIGTGGTITGIAYELKRYYPNIKIVGVEPKESPVVLSGIKGPHDIQGIGAGFIPDILDVDVIDKIAVVSSAVAKAETRRLSRKGLFVGISSGAAIRVALDLRQNEGDDKIILVIAPDGGFKYLSTEIYD